MVKQKQAAESEALTEPKKARANAPMYNIKRLSDCIYALAKAKLVTTSELDEMLKIRDRLVEEYIGLNMFKNEEGK